MRNLILSGLFTMAVVGGCVGSQGASQVGHSGGPQAEPEGIDAVFSHPLPDSIPGGQRGEQIGAGAGVLADADAVAAASAAADSAAARARSEGVRLATKGMAVAPAATAPANHSPYFDVDEAVFETGVKAEVFMALDYLERK